MGNANELMGLLHGAYGLGATIGPLISTAIVTKGGLQWFTWFYVMVCHVVYPSLFATLTLQGRMAVIELILGYFAFRGATGSIYRSQNPVTTGAKQSRTKESFKSVVTWLVAVFLFAYVGVEVALGGWIVTFMLEMRSGEAFASGVVATGFWLGITIGRVVLGFVTARIGEKLAVVMYLALSVSLQLLFWLIPSFIASAVFAAFLDFFLGPLYPAAIMVATKLLPRRLHVSAIGFVAAFGSSGAAIFPFTVGAIAQAKGVQVLQPFALALIVVIFITWILLPGGLGGTRLDKAHAKILEKEKEKAKGSMPPTILEVC